MKNIIILLIFSALTLALSSCEEDKIKGDSIFDTSEQDRAGLDLWLEKNIRSIYNIEYLYKWEDIESNPNYNLTPATLEKSRDWIKVIKFLLLESYDEAVGVDFTRTYFPKQLQVIGSKAMSSATNVVGTAEGGIKIILYDINNVDPTDVDQMISSGSRFKTMHHEFAHILHQLKDYPAEFKSISASDYIGNNWNNRQEQVVAPLGFVSRYAGSEANEDFVETISIWITHSDAHWDNWREMAGEAGWAIIQQKLSICREYLLENWNIDLDQVRNIVQRRCEELRTMDIETLYE